MQVKSSQVKSSKCDDLCYSCCTLEFNQSLVSFNWCDSPCTGQPQTTMNKMTKQQIKNWFGLSWTGGWLKTKTGEEYQKICGLKRSKFKHPNGSQNGCETISGTLFHQKCGPIFGGTFWPKKRGHPTVTDGPVTLGCPVYFAFFGYPIFGPYFDLIFFQGEPLKILIFIYIPSAGDIQMTL